MAWTLLLASLLIIGAILWQASRAPYLSLLGLAAPPEVQTARAEGMLRSLGIPRQPYRSVGYEKKDRYFAWVYVKDTSAETWRRFQKGLPAATFWLREQQAPLLDVGPRRWPMPTREEPPQLLPGASTIELDRDGRLYSLAVRPHPSWNRRAFAWNSLLEAAGLANVALTPVPPRSVPDGFADARAAWSGRHPADGTPIRIEAAAFRGHPVSFRIIAPWDEEDLTAQVPFGTGAFAIFFGTMLLTGVAFAAVLAWRNIRSRRGDREGAFRIGLIIFLLDVAHRLMTADHEASLGHELNLFLASTAEPLFHALLFGLGYIALEPYIRRRWPDRLIGWARLLEGRWRDPMVGRDVLIGLLAGACFSAVNVFGLLLRAFLRGRSEGPTDTDILYLAHPLHPIGRVLQVINGGMFFGLGAMTMLMLLTIVLRRRGLAAGAFFAIYSAGFLLASTDPSMVAIFVTATAIATFVLVRFGLLSSMVMQATFSALFLMPMPDTLDWYTMRALIPTLLVCAVAVWAFRVSLGGQRAFALTLDD